MKKLLRLFYDAKQVLAELERASPLPALLAIAILCFATDAFMVAIAGSGAVMSQAGSASAPLEVMWYLARICVSFIDLAVIAAIVFLPARACLRSPFRVVWTVCSYAWAARWLVQFVQTVCLLTYAEVARVPLRINPSAAAFFKEGDVPTLVYEFLRHVDLPAIAMLAILVTWVGRKWFQRRSNHRLS